MPDRETVYLAVPTYDERLHVKCMMGILHATGKRNLEIHSMCSSVLPFAFNQLWAGAIQSQCVYFAMLHSDIGPDPLWVDTLIDELESHDADIMAATVPIKDQSNRYSVAMCHMGQAAHYRLSVEHYLELPDTYDTADMQRVTGEEGLLCVNTGCWVCRLDRPWLKDVHFEFLTSIDWDGEKPLCQLIPEDWQLSQMLHRMGYHVMGTKAVRVLHTGHHSWQSSPMEVMEVASA